MTHQVNISALNGEFTTMGDMLLIRPGTAADGQLKVLARHSF